ncbi:glycosyltransferase family 2 protein [Maritimibacter sp. 55A14]|uniref:glycosyltransferase family 2 protein n=1 Tax=Maritimibacter sp. 55A14 TaxID=2174844 RepID=UPI001E651687|nr:glycosyltransferase family 2 protein [Maritimibacter sp. 55A14]
MSFEYLKCLSPDLPPPQDLACVALAHNELDILPDFLAHYRGLGVRRFLMVDDRSDDGTREFLLEQNGVTLFCPRDGSTYAAHKKQWRCELLDHFANGRWCIAPDIDEHFVYRCSSASALADLVDTLDAEGAEALHCTMVDMYADLPLSEHEYRGGGLLEAFPLFDGPDSYFMLPAASRFRRKYPTPFMMAYGGMRDRLFFGRHGIAGRFPRLLMERFGGLNAPFNPGPARRVLARVTRRAARAHLPRDPFTCTKLALIKWRKGMTFSGGSHAVTGRLKLSERSAVLLHFKFTRGEAGLEYIAKRGQHAGGGRYYRKILENQDILTASPISAHTRRFTGADSLGMLLR